MARFQSSKRSTDDLISLVSGTHSYITHIPIE